MEVRTTCVKIVITTGRDCSRPRGSIELNVCVQIFANWLFVEQLLKPDSHRLGSIYSFIGNSFICGDLEPDLMLFGHFFPLEILPTTFTSMSMYGISQTGNDKKDRGSWKKELPKKELSYDAIKI